MAGSCRILMTDSLPSSQALGGSDTQQIFLRPDGTNWQIFVEAGAISGGFKLRRLLKKAGATLCSDPRQSQVILVDSSTTEGRLFIRDWGKDENKVVLEYSWVNSCISEGKVLDANDHWGGFLTQDDGLPIVKEETDDLSKSPLPTPRDTPEDLVTSFRGRAGHDRPTVGYLAPTSAAEVPRTTMVQSQSPSGVMQPLSPDVLPHHQFGESHPTSTHIPPSQLSTVQPMIQPALHPSQGYPMDHIRALADFLSQQSDPRFGPQYTPLAVAAAMGGMPTSPWPWGVPPENIQGNSLQMMNSQGRPVDPSSLLNTSGPNISHSAQAVDLQYQGVPPSPTLLPSLCRRSPVVSRSSSESQKSKRRSRAASSGHPPSSAGSSSAVHCTSAPRQPSTQRGTLFTSETGKELSFFVQVDLQDRGLTTSAIKKNGGILCTDHTTADYSILYSRSTTFKDLCQSTHTAGRPAVSASFVHDCVRQNTVLDPVPYLFPLPASPHGKRKRQEVLFDGQSEDMTRAKKSREKANTGTGLRKGDGLPASKVKKEASSPELNMIPLGNDRIKLRSPTPPPQHTHGQLTAVGFKYSEHEREYALRYVDVLLERDHQMSISEMAGNLYKKIPNHTLASWRSFLVRTIRDDVELIRKRKSIAYRKAQRADQGNQKQLIAGQIPDQSSDDGPSASSPSSTPVVDRGGVRKDLETISHFFATRPEEEEDDADVWARLTSQATCRSASSWEEFYTEHHEEVNSRFSELTTPMPEEISTGLM